MAVKILLGLRSDDRIILQIMENNVALAHAIFDREQALKLSTDIKSLAEKIETERKLAS